MTATKPITEPPSEPEYVPEPLPRTYSEILLEKVAPSPPDNRRRSSISRPQTARLGTVFSYTYKSLSLDEARRRAAAALVREWPGEDRLLWKEIR